MTPVTELLDLIVLCYMNKEWEVPMGDVTNLEKTEPLRQGKEIKDPHIYAGDPVLAGDEAHVNKLCYYERPLSAVNLYFPSIYKRAQLQNSAVTPEELIVNLTHQANYRRNEIAYLSWLQVRGGRVLKEFPELKNGDVPPTGFEGWYVGSGMTQTDIIADLKKRGTQFVERANRTITYSSSSKRKFSADEWSEICKGNVPKIYGIDQIALYEIAADTFGRTLAELRAESATRNSNEFESFRNRTRAIVETLLPPIMYRVNGHQSINQIYTLAEREFPIVLPFEPKDPNLKVMANAGALGQPMTRQFRDEYHKPMQLR